MEVTNVHQIRALAAQVPKVAYSFHLEGDVWWVPGAIGSWACRVPRVSRDPSQSDLLKRSKRPTEGCPKGRDGSREQSKPIQPNPTQSRRIQPTRTN